MELTQYTFTIDNEDEGRFNSIMNRLDPDEFVVVEPLHKIPAAREHDRQSEMQAIIKMEPEAASTFRFGMKRVGIKRLRSEEEEAEKQAIEDRNKIKITVYENGVVSINGTPQPTTPTDPKE
jgi:hypothetical protein